MEQIDKLLDLIKIEKKAQTDKWTISESVSLKQLKNQGLVIHPIKVNRRSYGFAEFPVLEFTIPFSGDYSSFKSGVSIELINDRGDSCAGMLNFIQGKKGELRLHTSDFPDWTDDGSIGVKLVPDDKSFDAMKDALKNIKNDEKSITRNLFQKIHGIKNLFPNDVDGKFNEKSALNTSQQDAVKKIIANQDICIIHGPPGTGKTTTLVQAIKEITAKGEKVLVSAPSNTAVDHISQQLLKAKVNVLRLGNASKVNEELFKHTPEGIQISSEDQKQIKRLQKQSNEFRKMANQYKRSFGKSEREQRKALIREVKSIRKEIINLRSYGIKKAFNAAQVITGTPVGLQHDLLEDKLFDTVIIDEAGQCLEPMAWVAMQKGKRVVLAGDPFQLPPTVISDEAKQKGLGVSILERCFKNNLASQLLEIQYRMKSDIAGFSSNYFYNNKLKSANNLISNEKNIVFFDTAGSDCEEKKGKDGYSLMNDKELETIGKIIELENLSDSSFSIISPYSGQVNYLRNEFPRYRVSTIDSFQGQEDDAIIISLVRSNKDGVIGFLKDYRRMNVALTRAKNKLYIVGDSSTFGADKFYSKMLEYIEQNGLYRSVFELDY